MDLFVKCVTVPILGAIFWKSWVSALEIHENLTKKNQAVGEISQDSWGWIVVLRDREAATSA